MSTKPALVFGSDHAGLALKRVLQKRAEELGYTVTDVGTHDEASTDYPDWAHRVAAQVVAGQGWGVLVCGTGIGMSISANRHKGVRAALCGDVFSAKMTRAHNDANVLSKDGREIRRRRECEACTRRFTTYERVEESMPLVIKRDGRREPFDRNKIERGLQFAVAKRQVSLDQVKATAEQIEREIEALGVAEIESRTIGERVLPKLRALDQVAFVRFASIYRDFRDLDELAEQIDALRAPPEPIAGEATGPTSAAGAGALGEPERTDEGAAYDDGTAAGGAA